METTTWTKDEKAVARFAFEQAYARECESIMTETGEMLASLTDPRDIWQVHDFLSGRRKTAGGKYDYRYSVLLGVLARLLREGWISQEQIAALSEDKKMRIRFLASI